MTRTTRGALYSKRWLYLIHRWIGIASCLLFAMWFASGLVMIYVPFPALSAGERLAGLPPLALDRVAIGPAAAAVRAGMPAPASAALEMEGATPVWRVRGWTGDEVAVLAETGRLQRGVGRQAAAAIAAAFARRPVARIDRVERDQWTVAGGYDRHRPLWKASLAGPGGHVLYVSSQTGAVVLDTAARERFWNWVGSIPHWIYPTVLRRDNAVWRQVVMWVSGPCMAAAITGLWIGLLRVRLGARRFTGGRTIPYRGSMAWHHVAGLFGGLALIGWIFSGWLSVDPFRLFASTALSSEAHVRYGGTAALPPFDRARVAAIAPSVRRLVYDRAAGRVALVLESPGAPERWLDPQTLRRFHPSEAEIVARGRRLLPGAPLRAVERLSRPDAYWYEVGDEPMLPMLRLRFGDAARTWVYLDPATGAFAGETDRKRRLYRWAFDLLHKWDVNALTLHRPLWDGLLWLLSILGLVTSATGIWIGWRRLTRGKALRRA